jgi:hypothetical protein
METLYKSFIMGVNELELRRVWVVSISGELAEDNQEAWGVDFGSCCG